LVQNKVDSLYFNSIMFLVLSIVILVSSMGLLRNSSKGHLSRAKYKLIK